MPKPTKGARLGGSAAHQKAMLANLATDLFEHGRITTTEAKARRLRPVALAARHLQRSQRVEAEREQHVDPVRPHHERARIDLLQRAAEGLRGRGQHILDPGAGPQQRLDALLSLRQRRRQGQHDRGVAEEGDRRPGRRIAGRIQEAEDRQVASRREEERHRREQQRRQPPHRGMTERQRPSLSP